jgi:hypothetical protein
MNHLYKLTVLNKETQETADALVKADNHPKAEEKGKEWARKYEGLGYEFYMATHLSQDALDNGYVVTL